ncbi:MAG TPA: gamma-glutamylcyclotransferase family protein, partial [Steroidobacteraceae bacterium]|nr:gamma-glutamylcyclotransferase family protein [Steroidobacteraceae bacterium]
EGAPPRLFVYGSLRTGQANPVAALLHGHARHLGPGTVCARLYVVSWYGGMVPSDAAEDRVHGDVFELAAETAERVLAELDAYEGDGFARTPVEVAMGGETRVAAFAYLYAGSVAGLARMAHGDWLRRD